MAGGHSQRRLSRPAAVGEGGVKKADVSAAQARMRRFKAHKELTSKHFTWQALMNIPERRRDMLLDVYAFAKERGMEGLLSEVIGAISQETHGVRTEHSSANFLDRFKQKRVKRSESPPMLAELVQPIRKKGFGRNFDSEKILAAIDAVETTAIVKDRCIFVLSLLAKHGPLTQTELVRAAVERIGKEDANRIFPFAQTVNSALQLLNRHGVIVRKGKSGCWPTKQYLKKQG